MLEATARTGTGSRMQVDEVKNHLYFLLFFPFQQLVSLLFQHVMLVLTVDMISAVFMVFSIISSWSLVKSQQDSVSSQTR